MNEKERMWFKLSEHVTPEMEEKVLEKYGDRSTAILTWWGRQARPEDDDFWELCVCKKWNKEGNENGTIG